MHSAVAAGDDTLSTDRGRKKQQERGGKESKKPGAEKINGMKDVEKVGGRRERGATKMDVGGRNETKIKL